MSKNIEFHTRRGTDSIKVMLVPFSVGEARFPRTDIRFKAKDYQDFLTVTEFIADKKDPIVKEAVDVFYESLLEFRFVRDCKHRFGKGRPKNDGTKRCMICYAYIKFKKEGSEYEKTFYNVMY